MTHICSAHGYTPRLSHVEAIDGIALGDTFISPDETFELVRPLSPSEAHRIARDLVPETVLGLAANVRACDVNPRTIENDSVCRVVWTNNLAVVVEVDRAERTATILVRIHRSFSMKKKRYPAAGGSVEVNDFM